MFKVAVIAGSLRKDSYNRQLAMALEKLSHPDLTLSLLKIDDIPLYNQDLDSDLPASVVRFKKEIAESDAVLFVTPEYNRSIPGVLKNLIDWGTRPYGKNVWAKKPMAGIGMSVGVIGTAVAQSHLRSIMVGLDAHYMGQPEVYLVHKDGLIDESFSITLKETRAFLEGFLERFAKWIKHL